MYAETLFKYNPLKLYLFSDSLNFNFKKLEFFKLKLNINKNFVLRYSSIVKVFLISAEKVPF